MKRISFLKMGTLAMLTPLADSFFVQAVLNTEKKCLVADDIMKDLIAANDAKVGHLLASLEPGNLKFSRRTGYDIAILSASYCSEGSKYYHDPLIVSRLELLIRFLAASQSADGTVNIANLESPPDTAFLMEILCAVAHILLKDNSKELSAINNDLEKIIVKAGDALSKGGVHTPNHRWVICAALAQINALYPDKKYRDRIEDWLGEGIFIDQDGHYPERSGNYAAVENTAFITMARLLNKPSLLQPVRKNLEMMYYYMEPDGELVSADSRRQDQYAPINISLFYLQYRYMAIRDNDSHFAAIVKQIESLKGFREAVLDRSLFLFMENSLLQKELPAPGHLPVDYEKLFATSHLLRIRRNNITTTLFGGVDWPLIIASGRSNSPNFFSYRKGNAVLKYMRLSSGFFSMGYFYSDGLRKDGNKYILSKKLKVPYYQPLPKDKRNSRGDYTLSPSIDDRFWNKMDFKNRPVSNVKTLDTTIIFTERKGAVELNFQIDGLKGVPVTIELCFKEGGNLSGVIASDNNNFFHEKDFAEYSFGEDRIRFGPGSLVHRSVNNLEGERYSTHFGSLRTDGMHVYLTGVTPFHHKLVFS